MNPNLTASEKIVLIAAVRKHHPELANWLERRPNLLLTKRSFEYGETILERGHVRSLPEVGIVMSGVVEVQGNVQHLSDEDRTLDFPLALRRVGEAIGEVEHSAFRLYNNLWRRPWTAYAGMQSFYITPLRSSKDSYLGDFKNLMKSRKKLYQTTIANINLDDIDEECGKILGEISLKRLLSITSVWQPDRKMLKEQYNVAKADPSLLATVKGIKTAHIPSWKSLLLYTDIVAAIQGARVTFRPFSEQEIKEVMPWDTALLTKLKNEESPIFNSYLILGIHGRDPMGSVPFVILPHFYCTSYGSPEYKSNEKSGNKSQFNTDLVTAVILTKAYSDWTATQIATQSMSPEGLVSHEVVAIVTDGKQQPRIISSAGDSPQQLIAKIRRGLDLEVLQDVSHLNTLGMLGKASLVVFPPSNR